MTKTVMDEEILDRIEDLERVSCCGKIVFYSVILPEVGKIKVLYIEETTGVQSIWNGSTYIDL